MHKLIQLFKALPPKKQKIIVLGAIACIVWTPIAIANRRLRSSAPRTQTAGALQSQPDRFISSGGGISFYERENGCVIAKGVTEDYLRQTNQSIWEFKAVIKRRAGKTCVLFE